MESSSPPPLPIERPSRLEIVLSAVGWPGAGQLLQQRWAAGLLFGVGSLATAILLLRETIVPSAINLAIALEMGGHSFNEPMRTLSIPRILTWTAAFLAVYVVSLLDTIGAYHRRQRRWSPHPSGSPS